MQKSLTDANAKNLLFAVTHDSFIPQGNMSDNMDVIEINKVVV